MLKALLLVSGLVSSPDTVPPPIDVVPLVMEATLSKVFPDGERPDRPITVHLGSFMRELNRHGEDPVKASNVISLLEEYGYSEHRGQSPFCETCDLSKGPVLWLKIDNLERTASGYRVEVREEHPYLSHDGEWKRSFSVFPYEFVWNGEAWETSVSGRIIQS